MNDNVKRQCRCTGLSGSCTIRTCWQAITSPENLAHQLKIRYHQAIEVLPNLIDNNLEFPSLTPYHIHGIYSNDLLYWSPSPDYCQSGNSLFSTRGRRCNHSLPVSLEGSCNYLCCGRGYQTRRFIQNQPCHCHYVHCCSIQCETCSEQMEEQICQ